MKQILPLILITCAAPAIAQETRQMHAHEHGVGELNIAFDGPQIAIELHAPGADIVGFEYAAETADDRAAIDAAVATLARPLDLFVLPAAAECAVTQASAGLESEAHDDHDEAGHDDHDDHEHDAEHADEHAEEHHEDEAGHTEFHAEYLLTCANPGAITGIEFAYFDTFQNARELEVQMLTPAGAKGFEVERDAPTLDLRGMF